MAANTTPIFTLAPKNLFASTGTSANTNLDGTGTVVTIGTAGAEGSYIQKLRLTHMGSNVATVVRIFINNGSTNATPANNALVKEITMASNTLSQTAASTAVEVPIDLRIAAGYKLNVTIGTSIAAGIMVEADVGDY